METPSILSLASALALSVVSTHAAVSVYWTEVGENFQAEVRGSFYSAELAEASFSFQQTFGPASSFDGSPGLFIVALNGVHNRWAFDLAEITLIPEFTKAISYQGNTPSGDVFSFVSNGNYLVLTLGENYVAGTSINSTLLADRNGQALDAVFILVM
jgi:hypothetical protein